MQKSILDMSKDFNPVYWTKGKQAPANRTTYFEVVKYHITGNQQCYDFTDIHKAIKAYNSGREITVYIERHGFRILKGLSERTKLDPDRNCGMTPQISVKNIATFDNKHHPLTEELLIKIITLDYETNSNPWKETITF